MARAELRGKRGVERERQETRGGGDAPALHDGGAIMQGRLRVKNG